ncbi:MAG: sulfotransferase [Planctomycetota bacterium]
MAVRPIFIVGTGRSGTTLLRALLNAHPDLHISKESTVYLKVSERKLRRSPREELDRFFTSAPFRWLDLDPADVRKRLAAEYDRKDIFESVLRADAEKNGKVHWGDKTPGHWMCLEDLKMDFPDALIIHIMRDPRQVVPSLMRMPWASPSWLANTLYCERALKALLKP